MRLGLKGNLKKHVDAIHLARVKHNCDECGKTFSARSSQKGNLKKHQKNVHLKGAFNVTSVRLPSSPPNRA